MPEREGGFVPEEARPKRKKIVAPPFGPEGRAKREDFEAWCKAQGHTLPNDTSRGRGKVEYTRLMLSFLDASGEVSPLMTNQRIEMIRDAQEILRQCANEGDSEKALEQTALLRRMLVQIERGIRAAE